MIIKMEASNFNIRHEFLLNKKTITFRTSNLWIHS